MNPENLEPVLVGGFSYTVRFNSESDKELYTEGLYAQHDLTRMELQLRTDLTEQMQGECLLHEMVHAIVHTYMAGQRLDEGQVEAMAQGLFQVMRDNPEVMTFIQTTGQDDDDDKVADCPVYCPCNAQQCCVSE